MQMQSLSRLSSDKDAQKLAEANWDSFKSESGGAARPAVDRFCVDKELTGLFRKNSRGRRITDDGSRNYIEQVRVLTRQGKLLAVRLRAVFSQAVARRAYPSCT